MIENNSQKNIVISIITSVLNSDETIERTIESVINQSYSAIEYIIIDGGSTDKTMEIINKYKSSIAYIESEPDKGLYSAMNKGASRAKGDYLYFLNADDWLWNDHVIESISPILMVKSPGIMFGNTRMIYPDYTVTKSRKFNHNNLSRGKIPPHQGSFIKKEIFLGYDGFDETFKYAADLDLFCRLKDKSVNILEIDKTIANVTAGGISSRKNRSYPEVLDVIKRHYGKLSAKLFWLKKIVIEQGLKKLLKRTGLESIYIYLTRVINKE